MDAPILMRAALGANTGPMLEALRARNLATTDRAVLEVSRRIELGLKRPELLDALESVVEQMTVVPVSALTENIPHAQAALRDSVPGAFSGEVESGSPSENALNQRELEHVSRTPVRETCSSRNGSTTDAHVLALAWSIDADVWTHDRDFAGTGVPTWSTVNLLRALFRTQ